MSKKNNQRFKKPHTNNNQVALAAKVNDKQLIVNQVIVRPSQHAVLAATDWVKAYNQASSINERRLSLYRLYKNILIDTTLTTVWEKRIEEITNSDWQFTNEKGEQVPEIMDIIDTPEFEDMVTEIMNAKAWGITVLEFEPGKDFKEVYSIPRTLIRPKQGIIAFDENSEEGIAYRDGLYGNWVFQIGKNDELGFLNKAAFWVIIKRACIGDFAQFSELYGMPIPVGEYDSFDEQTKVELEKAFEEIGSAGYIIKPKGSTIELLQNQTNGDGSIYKNLYEICNKEIILLVAGETMTTQEGKGSGFALGKVHQDTKEGKEKSDKRFVRRLLNRHFKKVLEQMGYPIKGGKFLTNDDIPAAERLQNMELFALMRENGTPVDDEFIYEQTGVPKPKEYDKLKEDLKTNPVPPAKPKPDPGNPNPGKKQKQKLSWFDRQRIKLADFFDLAP